MSHAAARPWLAPPRSSSGCMVGPDYERPDADAVPATIAAATRSRAAHRRSAMPVVGLFQDRRFRR